MSGKTAWAVLFAGLLSAEDLYRKPPRAVLDVLDIPPTPQAIASPTSGHGRQSAESPAWRAPTCDSPASASIRRRTASA